MARSQAFLILLASSGALLAPAPALAQTSPSGVPITNQNPFGKPELDERRRPDQKAILDRFEAKLVEFERALATGGCATATLARLDIEAMQERGKVQEMERLVRRLDDDVELGTGTGRRTTIKNGDLSVTEVPTSIALRTHNSLQDEPRIASLVSRQIGLHEAYSQLPSCDPAHPDAPRLPRGVLFRIGGGLTYFFEPGFDIAMVGLDAAVDVIPRVSVEGRIDFGVSKQTFDNGSTLRTSGGIAWSGTAALAYTLPVTQDFDLTARGGYGAFRFTNAITVFTGGTSQQTKVDNTVGAGILGVGASYDLGGGLEVEADYDRIFFSNGSEGNRLGLSLRFEFGTGVLGR